MPEIFPWSMTYIRTECLNLSLVHLPLSKEIFSWIEAFRITSSTSKEGFSILKNQLQKQIVLNLTKRQKIK